MYQLNDQQIDVILSDLLQRGIETESLRLNLLDHICILIEENLEEDGDFYQYYITLLPQFYQQQLSELEKETQFLTTLPKRHILLSRNAFFILLSLFLIGPFTSYGVISTIDAVPFRYWDPAHKIYEAIFVFSLFPLLITLVLFFTPDRLEPLIPRRSNILIGGRPFIRVLPVRPRPSSPGIPASA